MIDGLAVVDKPAGMTSHDVVGRARKVFAQKRVGHAGTLDPDATGVLLLGLGRVTRLMQYMSGLAKSYTTEIVLGVATTTLDAAGEVTGEWDMSAVDIDAAREAAVALTGEIEQIPPMVSAVKIGGRRLHELARQGIEVERSARPVTVSRFHLEEAEPESGEDPQAPAAPTVRAAVRARVLRAEIDCSSGTYVRVLAADLGRALGGGAHVRRLRRTAVGPWTVGQAVPLDQLGAEHVLAPADALPWIVAVHADGATEESVRHGRVMSREDLGGSGDGPWRVLNPGGELLAVYEAHRSGLVKPRVVLAPG